jgi:NTE family protein
MEKTTISLVLGSGGARGLTHIGVIRCLEEMGYEIRYISGTSIGALIGGIYAAGKLDEYETWVCELDKTDVVRLLDWSFNHGAIFKGERIIGVLKELVGDRNIEDLPIGFTAVATDLNSEREVWFNRGSLFDAIRASVAIPMVFEPVIDGKRLLVDGGLVNPIPIAPTLNDNTDLIIAVDLNASPEGKIEKQDVSDIKDEKKHENEYRRKLVDFFENLFTGHAHDKQEDVPGFYDLMMRSMDAMQTTIASFKLAAYKSEIIINIPRDLCGFFEFYRARELINFGYNRAKEIMEKADIG